MVYNSDKIVKAMISLIGSAIFGYECEVQLSEEEFKTLYSVSKKHSITNIVYYGLKKCNIELSEEIENIFSVYTYAHFSQYIHQKSRLEEIKSLLNENAIPFIVLKGSRMRKYYPSEDMRTSCDIDILFDGDENKITQILTDNNYKYCIEDRTTINFTISPSIMVEMHRSLFDKDLDFNYYFNNMFKKCQKLSDTSNEYIMSEEDFYAYMVAHMAKHFSRYGSGIRTVLDLWVYHKNAPDNFDYEKAKKILEEIGLLGFEQRVYSLLDVWFSDKEWSESDLKLTDYIVGAGIYGNASTRNSLKLISDNNVDDAKRKQKIKFLFPSLEYMTIRHPFLKKAPFLLPFFWFVRGLQFFTPERKLAFEKQKKISNIDDDYVKFTREVMDDLQLDANVFE